MKARFILSAPPAPNLDLELHSDAMLAEERVRGRVSQVEWPLGQLERLDADEHDAPGVAGNRGEKGTAPAHVGSDGGARLLLPHGAKLMKLRMAGMGDAHTSKEESRSISRAASSVAANGPPKQT
mmetsp:Transcript_7780/g.22255  ORF Transcript_7780/g.22255 Transcript_7780/m.22255 type:complete len:125 (-) Transcript_7780:29-403(-)